MIASLKLNVSLSFDSEIAPGEEKSQIGLNLQTNFHTIFIQHHKGGKLFRFF